MLKHKTVRACRNVVMMMLAVSIGFSAYASDNQLKYKVLLDNKEIGYHQFQLSELDGVQTIKSDAKFDVKLLFITAFKYRHSSFEQWQDNCLRKIESNTVSNGKKAFLRGTSSADRFELIKQDDKNGLREQQLDGCVKTFAYWNASILEETTLLNNQTGDYVDVTVSELGLDPVVVDDNLQDAVKYRITSVKEYAGQTVDITLWYSADTMRWLALEAPAKGNRILRYEALNINQL